VWWRLLKTAVFSVVAPGSVGLLAPYLLRDSGKNRIVFPAAQHVLGGLFLLLGVSIYLWCGWDFVVKGLGTPAPIDAPKNLVVQGLYRYTRNPMYVGVAAMIAGQSIYRGSIAMALYLFVVITLFNLFVLFYEEPTLRRQFGEQYNTYCRAVPRWFLPSRHT
jgi:protein-S-isoprenylcysteine O-methyltransferase Ste14